jgi:predicted N-formylglutamate amidohydrolase
MDDRTSSAALTAAKSARATLLAPDEPPAVEVYRPNGRSRFVIVCDHAGKRMPRKLNKLGLPDSEIDRHIGWDIGIAGVVRGMADALDAIAILQPYSRLVIDCNRQFDSASAIPIISENTTVPGNDRLTAEEIQARRAEIFAPYHERITAELDARERAGVKTILISMHSFVPVYKGVARPWHVGTLYQKQAWLADIVFEILTRERGLVVGNNQPYAVTGDDYSIPVHGENRNLPHAGIEIRHDGIRAEAGQREWAARMARVFSEAETRL